MVKRYRTVSARIEEGTFNRFLDYCETKDCKPNTMLKNFIEKVLKDVGKERRLEKSDIGNSGGETEASKSRFNDGSR